MEYSDTFGCLIKSAREQKGLSQTELARRINSNQGTISDWEHGKTVPAEMIASLAKAVEEPEILHAYAFHMGLLMINIPFMNNVDNHPITVLTTLRQEMMEAIESIEILTKCFRNKRNRKAFDEYEWEHVLKHVKRIAKLMPGLAVYFTNMAKQFDMDLQALGVDLTKKYRRKNYIK